MKMEFSEWLLNEMKRREISQADLSRLSGITSAQISRIINGERKPGETSLIGIAKALKLQPETLFEKAGILPPSSEKDFSPIKRKLLHLAKKLPDSDLEMVIALLEQREEYYKKHPQPAE